MKNLIKAFSVSSVIAYAVTITSTASAAFADGFVNTPQPTGVTTDFEGALMSITNWVLGFITLLATLIIIWGGVQYVTSAGNDDSIANAKKTISYGIIGLIVAGLAYAVVMVVRTMIL